MNKSNSLYMHTINGRTAYFGDDQIVYFNRYSRVTFNEVFVDSLAKIKTDQEATIRYRKRNNFYTEGEENKYSYVRIQRRDYKLPPEKDFKL